MKNLPANLIIEKNKIATPNSWLVLLDVTLTDNTKFYLVKNTENITFQGNEYTAMNFEIEPTAETSKGEIPTVTLRISNVTRIIQAYLEELEGCIGATVVVRVVNAAYLAEDYSELEMTFDVLATNSDVNWVSFTLGAPNPLRRRFPLYRYIANHCGWSYKSAECGYSGALGTCERTLDDCRNHNSEENNFEQSKRFGGFHGLNGDVRLA